MPMIQTITTHALTLPMRSALRWGKHSSMQALEHVLVHVTLSDGSTGIAEAPARPTIYGETPESIHTIIQRHLAPALIGLEIANTPAINEALASVAQNACARGALDIALWEARTHSQGMSLYEHLAGPKRRLQVSFILGIASVEAMLNEARRVFEAGVRVFKIKIGRDEAHDSQLVQALREVFTDDVLLYADANEMLDPQRAAKRLEHLANLGIQYVEEPLPVHMLGARAALKRANILPIIADDSAFTPQALERELEADTFDILNIKTARTGFTDSLAMLKQAEAAGKGVMLGSQAQSGLGTYHTALIASQAGVTHPSELSFPLKLSRDSLQISLSYHEGYLDLQTPLAIHLADPLS